MVNTFYFSMILNMAARAVVDLYLVMPNVHDGK
jgi:hypothetical protein